ncbi:hypothetical protein QEN19_000681 [Hanseniaspora menglaensis]
METNKNNTNNWMNDLENNGQEDYALPNFNFNNNTSQQQHSPMTEFLGSNITSAYAEEEKDDQKNSKTRSRIPREVLEILLQEFQINNSPNGEDRKRLASQCNIEEKRVRIWFQNKRAKLKKLQNNIQANGGHLSESDYNYLQQNNENSGNHIFDDDFEVDPVFDHVPWDLNNNYYFIDSSSVSVGNWRRLKNGNLSDTDQNGHEHTKQRVMDLVSNLSNLSPKSIDSIMGDSTDLLLIISKKNNEINYFFSAIADDRRILFRVFFPIYSVVNCSISVNKERHNSDSQENEDSDDEDDEELCTLSLMLNKTPKFAVYFADGDEEEDDNQWNICEDFSEDKQVSMSFIGSYEIPHIVTGLEDSLKKMNSLILEYNSKFGSIYHVPKQQTQSFINTSTVENNVLSNNLLNTATTPFTESLLKKSFANPFAQSEFGFSPTPSNGVPFFQMPTTPSFLNGSNNFSGNNHTTGLPYMENPIINNNMSTNNNSHRIASNNTNELLNSHQMPQIMEHQHANNLQTTGNEGLLNINNSLIEDDEMKNDLYINSMLDLH